MDGENNDNSYNFGGYIFFVIPITLIIWIIQEIYLWVRRRK